MTVLCGSDGEMNQKKINEINKRGCNLPLHPTGTATDHQDAAAADDT